MEFSEKIQALRSKAQETQAAIKILDMLTQLKLTNDETSSCRWIWELIQNAKDVCNSSGLVDIVIDYNKVNKVVKFSHNGKLFSTENIVFLIEQVSTKDRTIVDAKNNKTTGKFGTGFLTTHLLSEKVKVSGYLQDIGEQPCSFNIVINRSGTNKQSIISAIQESCAQLDKNTTISDVTIDEKDFNTCFEYVLDENGVLTAEKGLKNLLVAAPYVLAFVPVINSITVTSGQYIQKINRNDIIDTELDNAIITGVVVSKKEKCQARYICVYGNDDLSIAVEVEEHDDYISIAEQNAQLPKLFCDFPLLGTNDFAFPIVINSSQFNPTEPRNGIYLSDKEHEQIVENKQRMSKACQLYIKLLDYFIKKNYKGIYNIAKIPEQYEKDWLSTKWFEREVIQVLKSHIKEIPLVYTHGSELKPLFDYRDDPCVLIAKDEDKGVREKVWTLSSKLIPNMIPKHEELECWYNSLWEDCRNYGVLDLVERVEKYNNIHSLSEVVDGNAIDWINDLLSLFYAREHGFASNLGRTARILPNQHGEFCDAESILLDCGIDEIYMVISDIVNLDLRNRLLDKNIKYELLSNVRKLTLDDVFLEIQKKLQSSHIAEEEIYRNILCLRAKQNDEQEDFLRLVKNLHIKEFGVVNRVSKQSDALLKAALRFWREKICRDVSTCECNETFASQYGFDTEHDAILWLSDFVRVLVKYDQVGLLDRIAILPNQYGFFKKSSELSLDSGEIDGILKEACKYVGCDVRETLLSPDVYLDLPENRVVRLGDISDKVTKHVRENKNNIGKEDTGEKEIFQRTYLWLRENSSRDLVKKCFKELLLNLHWFYNDNDIAESMTKVEEYNDVLRRYGVSGVQELEKILSRSEPESVSSDAVFISKELLAQWGISSEEDLRRALSNNIFGTDFLHNSKNDLEMFCYVKEILERSKKNIINYLRNQVHYDVSNPIEISNTISIIKKHDAEIYVIARPSDFGQIILYYDSELDMLDYEKDCELWVEDGNSDPQKITFGKMLKLTGVNKILLRRIKKND